MRDRHYDRTDIGVDLICKSAGREWNETRPRLAAAPGTRHGLRLLLALGMLGIAAPRVESQALYGAVTGNVTDSSGAAVADAKVTIVNSTTSESRVTETNASGGLT